MANRLRLGVLISGTGTNMEAIQAAIQAGELDAEICLVVSSNSHAKGIAKAQASRLETLVFEKEDYADPEAVDAKIASELAARDVDYIAMAGYMRKVTRVLLDAFPNRIVNLHPALLPAHPGAHAIQDAYDAGDAVTGITLHFANAEYDQGPIIFQHEVPIHEGESVEELESRIHDAEHEYYPKVLQAIAEGRVHVNEDRTVAIAPEV